MVQIIVIVVYLCILATLGYLGYSKTKNTKDYYLGGRKIHPVVMALSYGATFISTSAIVGFGGTAGVFGFSLLWLTFLNIFLGIFIAFIFFGKRTRRIGHNIQAHTFAEFLGKRYKSKFIQRFTGVVIFLFMPIYAAAVMIGAAKFIETGLKIDYNIALFVFAIIVATYVFFGGIKSVMYSDAFQGTLMIVGMSILLVVVYWKLGGITAAHQQLTDLFKNSEVLEQTKGVQAGGFQGWTSMPALFSKNWWTVISSIVMGVGIGVLAQPQLAVRFMTVKSDRDLNRAIPIGGVFIFLMTGVAFIIGALSNVFFFNDTGNISVVAAGNADSIIPKFLDNFIPEWFLTVFLVVLLSAGMSTISSQFHAIGTAVGRDIIGIDDKNPKKAMLITRFGMLIAIAFTILLSYELPNIWSDSIAISTALFFGLCCAAFLPMYFGALYFKKLTKTAAISGMLAGFSSSLLWMMFVHTKESKAIKISNLLFGTDTVVGENSIWQFVDPIIIALSVSIIVTIIVQIASKKELPKEHIDECFDGIK
ncbi:MAG: sodium:solute symporter [Firmicutes bacterium HGW-Firmicutes-21]|nr:MAG: sodium:solute symporter [Firmicutes bacterium HGW-Firmicutes-21]